MSDKKQNELDVRRAYEVIARIIGAREGVEITVKSIKKTPKEETA